MSNLDKIEAIIGVEECAIYKQSIRGTILQRLAAQEAAPVRLAQFEATVAKEVESEVTRERSGEIITQRAALTREIGAADAQRDRLAKHIGKMKRKAKVKGWGKVPDWPGDAPRTYYDLCHYVDQYDKLVAALD